MVYWRIIPKLFTYLRVYFMRGILRYDEFGKKHVLTDLS